MLLPGNPYEPGVTDTGDVGKVADKMREHNRLVSSRGREGERTAYGGRCAMCGLNFGLVVAAHIHPVAAPGSVDEVRNGLCLCPNHHQAFDNHRIWVNPDTGEIKVHPLLRTATTPGDRAVVDTLHPAIQLPADRAARPRPDMFRQRYAQPEFLGKYDWV